MQSLTVHVEDEEQGTRRDFVFSRSPVRIGRSPLNDLPLARPFVSHCHAVLHFSDRGFEYVDLGSTNGSYVDGQRVPQNIAIPLGLASTLQIGALRIRLSHGGAAGYSTRASYAFDAIEGAPGRPAAPDHGPAAAPTTGARQAVGAVAGAHKGYRAAWQHLFSEIQTRAATLPEEERETFARMLVEEYPDLLREPELTALMRATRWVSAPPATEALEDLLTTATGVPFPAALRPQLAARLLQVLERFAQTYLELQRGRAQFASEMAVKSGTGTAIEAAQDAREVLGRLFDLDSPDDPIDQLSRSYADLMLHQVALLNGVRAGISALLEQLDPSNLARRAPAGLVGWLGRVFGSDGRWKAFREAFEDLQEQKTISKVVFGNAFARAYAASMGGSSTVPAEDTVSPPAGDRR